MIPNYIEIETSSLCNRRCKWCPNYVVHGRSKQQLMPWSFFSKALYSLSSCNYDGWLAFHNYNEPLANPRIFEELRFARAVLNNAKIAIYTNGDYLSSDKFNRLVSLKIKQVRVTIYPIEKNMGQYSHENLWRWINKRSFLKIFEWDEELVRQGAALICNGDFEIILISPCIDNYYDRGGIIPFLSIEKRTKPCFLTSNSLSIDYMGQIKMCCNVVSNYDKHQQYILGNTQDNDILEVWNSNSFNIIRSCHKNSDWSNTDICRYCRQEINIDE